MPSRNTPPPIALYRRIAIGLLTSVAMVLLAIVYITLVHAEVIVRLKKQSFPITYQFSIRSAAPSSRSSRAHAEPLETSTDTVIGQTTTLDRTQQVDVAAAAVRSEEGKAEGVVRVTNRYSRSQPLVATTRLLSTEGILFRTTKRVDVPVGSSVDVPVVADQVGPSGDLPPTHFTIPGLWAGIQDKITGQSLASMHGGKKTISELDQKELKAIELRVSNQQKAEALKAYASATPGQNGEITIALIDSVSSETHPIADQMMRVVVRSRILIARFNPKPLEEPLRTTVSKALPHNYVFGGVDTTTPFEYALNAWDAKRGTGMITLKATAWGVIASDQILLSKEQLLGLPAAQVTALVANFPDIESIQVQLSPFWLRTIPRRADRVDLKIISPTS